MPTPPTPAPFDVVLPCLNEEAAIGGVLDRLPAGAHAIVVDNGCTDGTARIARDRGALVVPATQRGFGAACYAGLRAAQNELVAFLDADGSCDPGQLPRLLAVVDSGAAELVLGRRDRHPRSMPLHARVANAALAAHLRRAYRLPLRDLGPMRVCRRQPLLDLGLVDRRSGWPLEMVLRAQRAGWRVAEVDVDYRPRSGRSKVTGTVRGTLQAVTDMRAMLHALPPAVPPPAAPSASAPAGAGTGPAAGQAA